MVLAICDIGPVRIHPFLYAATQDVDQTRRMSKMSRVFARCELKMVCFVMSEKVLWSYFLIFAFSLNVDNNG